MYMYIHSVIPTFARFLCTCVCYYSGALEAVGQLDVSMMNKTVVHIFWNPPFTLKGMSILHYEVSILNRATGNETLETIPGSETTLQYDTDHLVPGTNMTATVVAFYEFGPGKPASVNFMIPVGKF